MAFLFSFLAGTFAVLQSGINKNIAQLWGLSSSLLLNGLVFLVFNFLLFVFVWWQPRILPAEYALQGSLTDMKWFWILPGLFGFLLVLGLTFSMGKIGALQTFVISIAAQMLVGLAWDALMENKPVTILRLVGAVMTFAGAWVATQS